MFITHRVGRSACRVMLVIMIGGLLVRAFTYGERIREHGLTNETLWTMSYLLTKVICYTAIIMRQKRIERLVRSISTDIPADKRIQRVIRMSRLFTTIFLVQVIVNITNGILVINRHTIVDVMMLVSKFTSQWIMITSIFYWNMLQLLSIFAEQQLACIKVNVESKYSDMVFVVTRLTTIADRVREFERLFSPIPFLWFAFAIISASATVFSVIRNPSDYLNLFYNTMDYLPPILVVMAVDDVFGKLRNESDILTTGVTLNSSVGIGDKILLINEIKKLKELRLTGMNFFSLDRSFILSYIASVLTFAALIAGFSGK
jgi:hypothetical protein